jgi:hypothetical protein
MDAVGGGTPGLYKAMCRTGIRVIGVDSLEKPLKPSIQGAWASRNPKMSVVHVIHMLTKDTRAPLHNRGKNTAACISGSPPSPNILGPLRVAGAPESCIRPVTALWD